jgi:hypothetical protein
MTNGPVCGSRDRPADEIEITEEMINAGLGEFCGFDPDGDSSIETVKAIYRAMVSSCEAKRTESPRK